MTPTICVGVLSGRLSSCNFFRQPLNPTATCKEQMGNIRLRLLRMGTGPRPGMGAVWFSQGAWSCNCWQGDLLQRGCRAGDARPCGPDGGEPSGSRSGCHLPQAGPAAFPIGQTPGVGRSLVNGILGPWEERSLRGIACALPPTSLPNLSPCATGQPVSAGDSGPGAGAQGPQSVRQSVHGLERVPVKGCCPTGELQRARGPGKPHVGGRASRGGA